MGELLVSKSLLVIIKGKFPKALVVEEQQCSLLAANAEVLHHQPTSNSRRERARKGNRKDKGKGIVRDKERAGKGRGKGEGRSRARHC